MYLGGVFKHHFEKAIHPEIHKFIRDNMGWIVGGGVASAIMNTGDRDLRIHHSGDIDLYFENDEREDMFIARIISEKQSPDSPIIATHATQCAFTITFKEFQYRPIQVLHLRRIYKIDKPFWDVLNALQLFDFTVIQVGYLLGSDNQVCAPSWERTLADLAARQLVISNEIQYPISTLVRVHKYLKKGFSIAPSQLVKLAIKINQCDISTIPKLKNQLYGIDMALLEPVIRAMEVGMVKSDIKIPEDARVHFLAELDAYLSDRV